MSCSSKRNRLLGSCSSTLVSSTKSLALSLRGLVALAGLLASTGLASATAGLRAGCAGLAAAGALALAATGAGACTGAGAAAAFLLRLLVLGAAAACVPRRGAGLAATVAGAVSRSRRSLSCSSRAAAADARDGVLVLAEKSPADSWLPRRVGAGGKGMEPRGLYLNTRQMGELTPNACHPGCKKGHLASKTAFFMGNDRTIRTHIHMEPIMHILGVPKPAIAVMDRGVGPERRKQQRRASADRAPPHGRRLAQRLRQPSFAQPSST